MASNAGSRPRRPRSYVILDSRLGFEARGFQRPRSGRMKASKAREGVANVDVLKLKVASRTPRKVRNAFRGPGSCCAPQGLDHKHKLISILLEQKGSLLATRQSLRVPFRGACRAVCESSFRGFLHFAQSVFAILGGVHFCLLGRLWRLTEMSCRAPSWFVSGANYHRKTITLQILYPGAVLGDCWV